MKLRGKIFIPLFGAVITFSLLGYLVINWQVAHIEDNFIHRMARDKMDEITQAVDAASQQALGQAALFTRMPEVIRAYEIAHTGNINDEQDEKSQMAREKLRQSLSPVLDGFSGIMGQRLKLHFHLPSGRSLARLWRQKQIRVNDRWTDISDDISESRNTVTDVNTLGKPIRGIELGQGGFVIRGLAPVRGADGRPLGSVEVLADFDTLLEKLSASPEQRLFLYMDAQYLPLTPDFQNPKAYPVIGERYVGVHGVQAGAVSETDLTLLDEARSRMAVTIERDRARIGFPVRDYRNREIGVIIFTMDISEEQALIQTLSWELGGIMTALVLVIGGLSSLALSRLVLTPINRVIAFAGNLAEGDLTQTLETHQQDEIGLLTETLNRMAANLNRMFGEVVTAVETLTGSLTRISDSVDQQAAVVTQQAASVSEITSTISELSASFTQIADHASTVATLGENALKATRSGADSVEIVMVKMEEISQDNQKKLSGIVDLGKKSKQIARVMDMINNISDQTKLIAFNAALEASSAGEAGKRFGVVAAEIRRLANSVMTSTGEIEQQIGQIQEAVHHMTISSESDVRRIQAGLEASARTSGKLSDIVSSSQSTADAAKQISLSIRQQKTASEQVVTALREIDEGSRQSTEAIRHISEVTTDLKALAAHLNGLVEQFRLTPAAPDEKK
ncbi:methyl-accepting chemotaxis protein [Desulfonema ishimotonii]|uniref:Methyl-accepting chemotaxis protein n=1 Tax=Desulfonema ishimotonii TaxID=45657 RepID=A0A401FT24_9BACT|nr:methyl-accepting chemotaxis protein [Desulfonema ishimotonii]GBC60122.1 methyl-accepting chemotaxis protein [Desulfonema ishimotonii]